MSTDHLNGSHHREQIAHICLCPLESLHLLRVNQPHGVHSIVCTLNEGQRTIQEHTDGDELIRHQTAIGSLRENLLDALLLRRKIVRITSTLLLKTTKAFLKRDEEEEEEEKYLGFAHQLEVLLHIFLR